MTGFLIGSTAGDRHVVLCKALLPVPAGEYGQAYDHAEGYGGAGVRPVSGAL